MTTYLPGSLVNNRYEVVSHPLMGGMGVVYLCIDREKDIPVALKTFKPEYLSDLDARNLFLQEGSIWMNMGSYPNIVRCYGVERIGDGSKVFLVLEQVAKDYGREDASLRSWLRPGHPLPVEQSLLFALQIARGMGYATTKIAGFVHRDLKPENVLVGADKLSGINVNRLCVTDFGLAHVLETVSGLSATAFEELAYNSDLSAMASSMRLMHGVVGTPLYMAPEQWAGEQVGIPTDIYALGCILYEMIAGRTLVSGETIEELEFNHTNRKYGPLPKGISEDIVLIINGCLSSNPAKRYSTWEQIINALENTYRTVTGNAVPILERPEEQTRIEQIALGWGYANLGQSYQDIGKTEIALLNFERVIKIGKTHYDKMLEIAGLTFSGEAFVNMGDAKRAIEYYEKALIVNHVLNDKTWEGVVLGCMGTAYKNLGNVRRAIEYHEKALTIRRETGDRYGQGSGLVALGIAYKNLGDASRAIEYYTQALTISREFKDRRMESNVLINIGIAYKNLNLLQDAINCYEQAFAIASEIGDRNAEESSLINLGNAYLQLNNAQQAILYTEKALKICKETSHRRGEGIALMNLGRAYVVLGETKKAVRFLEESEKIFTDVDDLNNKAEVSFGIATIFAESREFTHALSRAHEAQQIWAQLGDPNSDRARQFVASLNQILKEQPSGISNNSFGKKNQTFESKHEKMSEFLSEGIKCHKDHMTEQSINLFGKALAISVELDDDSGKAISLSWLGIVCNETGKTPQAVEYLGKALAINRKMGNRHEEAANLVNLGDAHQNLGDTLYAIDCYERAVIIDHEIGNQLEEANGYSRLGWIYAKLGDTHRAIENFEISLPVYRLLYDKIGIVRDTCGLASCCAEEGDYERALILAKEAARLGTKINHPLTQQAKQLAMALQNEKDDKKNLR